MDLIRGLCSEQGSALLLVSHDPSVLGRFARCESLARLNRATRMEGEP
jgi:ABC-type glutathione transport system ATPase component